MTAACGSFVESSLTASWASAKAFLRVRREDGFASVGARDSGGDNNIRSGTFSCVNAREEAAGRMDWGGGSERLSDDDAADSRWLINAEGAFRCENAATAVGFADGAVCEGSFQSRVWCGTDNGLDAHSNAIFLIASR